MFLIWFGFLACFGCDFDMVWERSAFSGFLTGWLQKKKQKQPRDRLLVDFSRVFVVLICF